MEWCCERRAIDHRPFCLDWANIIQHYSTVFLFFFISFFLTLRCLVRWKERNIMWPNEQQKKNNRKNCRFQWGHARVLSTGRTGSNRFEQVCATGFGGFAVVPLRRFGCRTLFLSRPVLMGLCNRIRATVGGVAALIELQNPTASLARSSWGYAPWFAPCFMVLSGKFVCRTLFTMPIRGQQGCATRFSIFFVIQLQRLGCVTHWTARKGVLQPNSALIPWFACANGVAEPYCLPCKVLVGLCTLIRTVLSGVVG